MSTHGPIANGPHALGMPRSWRWFLWLLTVVIAGVIGWLIHGNRTVSHTVTQLAPNATVNQDTHAGLVAAAQQSFAREATACLPGEHCPPTNAWPLGPDGGGEWSLGYKIISYTANAATVEAWQLLINSGTGGSGSPPASSLSWGTTRITLTWTGAHWKQTGASLQSPNTGPVPPPDGTTGAPSFAFQSQMSTWMRFPAAP
jgi:hypothetical protein